MKRRIVSRVCALIVIALLAAGGGHSVRRVYADELVTTGSALEQAVILQEELQGTEVNFPEEMTQGGTDPVFLKAVMLGYANMSDEEKTAYPIRKQDMMNVLYKTVISYDDSFCISQEEADALLNECYDNAFIDDENRIAYAFMIKQGVISDRINSDPNKNLTIESCRTLVNLIRDLFVKGDTVTVGGCEITKGNNIQTVISVLGYPNRIDASEYGFDWYVYNSSYDNFVMVGVYSDRICAVYTNNRSFNAGGVKSGDAAIKTVLYIDNDDYTFYSDPQGRIDAVLYRPVKTYTGVTEEVAAAQASEFVDLVNSYRSKNSKTIYIENKEMTSVLDAGFEALSEGRELNGMFTASGRTVFDAYSDTVNTGNIFLENNNRYPSPAAAGAVRRDGEYTFLTMVNFDGAANVSDEAKTVEPPTTELLDLEAVEDVTTPVIEQPTTETIYDEGDDVVIHLAMQASTQYHIEVFDLENDGYVINEYLNTDEKQIVLPASLFKNGSDYSIVVSSITPDGISLSADPIMISYGSAYDTGIKILTPYDGGITDDDYIAMTWESENYHDFRIDLYDQEGNLVKSEIVENQYDAMIKGIAPGEYYIYITALRRGTEIEKAQASVDVRVNLPEPVINEFILERNDRYYFIYEDKSLGVLYFYDEELVDVEQADGSVVTKKKIIQKQVKSTKGYRDLAKSIYKKEYTTGEPYITTAAASEMGNNIVREAERYLGIPYVWGGTTPSGFDCSGLVQYVMNTLGISVPRVSQDQYLTGTPISKGDLQPGDLVFFESNGDVHHVGIYVGDGMMLHAPRTGDVVKYQSIETPYYQSEYAGARRVY